MSSPWLDVPLADYEGHMSAAGVEQLGPLRDLFRLALDFTRPASVLVLGVAGGKAFDQAVGLAGGGEDLAGVAIQGDGFQALRAAVDAEGDHRNSLTMFSRYS